MDFHYHFQDGGRYHIETSPLICRANQWTGFYMITASALKGLKHKIEFLLYLELKLFNHDIKYSQK